MPDSVLLFSHETTLSGAPLALSYLAGCLQERGLSSVFAAPVPGPVSEVLQARGIEVRTNEWFLRDPEQAALGDLVAGFDLVLANTLASWPVVRAAHAAGRPAIWYLHETRVAFELMRKIPQIEPTFALADLLVTSTRQTARIYQDIARTKVAVVPYGIPEPKEVPAQPRNDDVLTFATIGSYERRKGQDLLVDAIRQLAPEIRERARFVFAGRDLEPEFFRRIRASAIGLANVEFGPALDHAASLQLLADSDVLVCPSRDETMPISIIEAMALGTSVISADVGGIAEWLRDGVNGRLVPPNDSSALARAITDGVREPGRLADFSAVARRTFARHSSLEKFGEHFAALIERTREKRPVPNEESNSYKRWIANYDTPSANERIALARRLRETRTLPRFSILLPVYNPDLVQLSAAIDSVTAQSYAEWELCVADDASTDPAIRPFLESAVASDPRIKAAFRPTNGHISAASNSALELATNEWCTLLDQDDTLAPDALAWMALEIAEHPDAQVIYSDEDKIDLGVARSNPFCKTAWNPELFLGQNYLNHLGVYRRDLLGRIGGFREGYEGSQDYDLALRCCENLRAEQIRHLPRMLYHWRMTPGSLAEVADAKPYAREAARRALTDHLQRQGIAGRVVACPENPESHRVIYELPTPAPLVTIIIPTRDHPDLLRRCLESIRGITDYPAFEFTIVDNGTSDRAALDYLASLEREPGMTVLRDDGAFNFSRLNNRAAAQARGALLAFVNNDIEAIEADWLREMASHAARQNVGAVGARLWFPNETLQHAGILLGLGGVAGHPFARLPRGHAGYFNRAWLQQNCSAVTAACMVVRREVFARIRGFDEQNLAISFNDVDLCLRLRAAGFETVWTPDANLLHHESASRGHQRTSEEQAQFLREVAYMQGTWGDALLHDPFYNPNLSLHLPGYALAFPPRSKSILLSHGQPEI